MPLQHHDNSTVEHFFSEIAPFEAAYRFPSFRFIALRCEGEWILYHGVLELRMAQAVMQEPFESTDIYVDEIPLYEIAESPREFVRRITTGSIEIGARELAFPPDQGNQHSAYTRSFDGAKNSIECAGSLTISGSRNYHRFMSLPTILRQLRTSDAAFDSIAELAAQYRMHFDGNTNLNIRIDAPSVATVTDDSRLELDRAHIALRLMAPLDPEGARLSLRGQTLSGVEVRLDPPPLAWSADSGGNWCCNLDYPFQGGKSITCRLSYRDFVQQERVVTEPASLRNTMRLVCDLFDTKRGAIRKVIDDAKIPRRDSLELEMSMAGLLSLAGYRTMTIDRVPGFGEIPDIIAADEVGNLLVIECSLSLPNAKDKMDKLFYKHKIIRDALDEAHLNHIKSCPILAVALDQDDVAPYFEDAQKAGILLWGRNDLRMLERWAETLTANEVYNLVMEQVSNSKLVQAMRSIGQ